MRERTLLIQRAVSLGVERTRRRRPTGLFGCWHPLREDLLAWKLRSGRPKDSALVFPGPGGGLWSRTTYDNWRERTRVAVGVDEATPYALRHSFASLLLHEGRSVVYVARQLGHDARPTPTTYGHVIDELDEQPRLGAEDAILAARRERCSVVCMRAAPMRRPVEMHEARNPRRSGCCGLMELGGLEPPTSWVRSRRSPN